MNYDPTALFSNLKRQFSGIGGAIPSTTSPTPAPLAIPKPAPFNMPKPGLAPTMGPTPMTPTAPMAGPAPFAGPVRPVAPTIAPPVATPAPVAPVAPTTSTGQTINTSTGGIVAGATPTVVPPAPTVPAPIVPTVPTAPTAEQSAVTAAEQAYKTAGVLTPEQEAAQAELDRLTESMKSGYTGAGQQAIPMEFITGQQKAIEQRGLNLAEPLTKKLARMEAKRLSGLETSKFALERADKNMTATEATRKFAVEQKGAEATRALAEKKFAEDTRQFGLDYAIKQRDINVKEKEAKIKADAAGTTAIAPQKALDQINLVKGSLDKADKLVHASGRSGARKAFEGATIGATDYTNLVAETNTLRTNVLTMMTDPSIKKFFGPQMSNADVQLMTSAGTTLNPELQDTEHMQSELTRLRDVVSRAEAAVKAGNSAGGNAPITAPDGRQIIITD